MIRSELYKMRHHATPRVLAGLLLFSVLAGPAYFAFKAPGTPSDHLDLPLSAFGITSALLASVYGAWLIGHEYRQDTLKRVVAADAARGRLLWAKALVGLVVAIVGLALIAALGLAAGALVADLNGVSVATDGLVREVLGAGVFTLGVAALAYLASLLLRSDTYAIVAVLGLITILDPLLMRLPRVGPYLPGRVLIRVSDAVAGLSSEATISTSAAVVTLGLTLAAVAAVAGLAFRRQDL